MHSDPSRLHHLLRRLMGERRAAARGGRRWNDSGPLSGWLSSLRIALAVALLDWTVKAAVAATVPLDRMVEVWDGRVALWHVRNPAMILGLWGGLPLPARQGIALLGAAAGALLLLRVVGRSHRLGPRERPWAWLFAGLMLGGMMGNVGERAVHWGVTDYLSFNWDGIWLPPGNVADVALFLSLPLAGVVAVMELRARSHRGTGVPHYLARRAARAAPATSP